MKTLLMIESWCFASGILLPRRIRELGHTFVLVTKDPEFYGKYVPSGETQHSVVALADEVVVCDTGDMNALLAACRGVKERRPVDGVISSCDYFLKAVAATADALGLPSSPENALAASTNKYLMRVAHREKGLPSPRFMLAESEGDAEAAAREVELSRHGMAIVKPADMNGSTLVRKVRSVGEMKQAISAVLALPKNSRGHDRFKGALVEEYLAGEEFSVECCAFGGEVHILGITDKKLGGRDGVVETGHMFPADIPDSDARALERHVTAALTAIGYTDGAAHVEIRMTPQGPRIVEINPRIGGNYISELVERVTGVSPLTQMVQVALGEEPQRAVAGSSGVKSAAVTFVIPEKAGTLSGYRGETEMAVSPGVVRYSLVSPGTRVAEASDNDCYLGYIITEDREGLNSGKMAAEALKRLSPVIAE